MIASRVLSLSLALDAVAGAARAGSVSCLWNAIPEARRTAFLAAYAQNGPSAGSVLIGPNDTALVKTIMTACKVDGGKGNIAGQAFHAYALQQGAGRVLQTRYHVDPTAIDVAWSALTDAQRKTFVDQVLPTIKPGFKDDPAVGLVATRLGLVDPDAIAQLPFYLYGLVTAAADEPQF
ncbi:MAG TPA: hypothetical protein VN671_13545 [Solirubrobacterales bacterium]|nr:hypothetical protein [Solirubrobacterales bacterium]